MKLIDEGRWHRPFPRQATKTLVARKADGKRLTYYLVVYHRGGVFAWMGKDDPDHREYVWEITRDVGFGPITAKYVVGGKASTLEEGKRVVRERFDALLRRRA